MSSLAVQVLSQNADKVAAHNFQKPLQVTGVVDGHTYKVGVNSQGHIRQLFPVK